jgi:hypothetical protein
VSGEGVVDAFGVAQERKDHPAIKAGREEDAVRDDAIGFRRVDGQRLFKGVGGSLSMGAKPRFKNTGGGSVNKAQGGGFKVRKRTAKG